MPNINDGYVGSAPDLGAHEYQGAIAAYGPRGSGPTPPPSNQAPTVSLTAPLSATFAAPSAIVIAAQAADPDGIITAVEFYAGTKLLGTATGGGSFSIVWQVEKVGNDTLTARAVDNLGLTATSAPVTVQITKKPRR